MRPLVVFEPVTDIYQLTTAQRRLLNSCLNRKFSLSSYTLWKKMLKSFVIG